MTPLRMDGTSSRDRCARSSNSSSGSIRTYLFRRATRGMACPRCIVFLAQQRKNQQQKRALSKRAGAAAAAPIRTRVASGPLEFAFFCRTSDRGIAIVVASLALPVRGCFKFEAHQKQYGGTGKRTYCLQVCFTPRVCRLVFSLGVGHFPGNMGPGFLVNGQHQTRAPSDKHEE